MRRVRDSWVVVLAVGIFAAVGCGGPQPVSEGSVHSVVTLPQALSAMDVARVELTVSGAGMTTRTDALVKTGEQWGGVLGQLPAGTGRTFSAQAFDASNTVRYSGQVANVTIQAGQTTAVTMLLQEVNPPTPFENAAPRITSLVASPATVAPGGQVALQAAAQDANTGDTLTYTWAASTGSFSAASSLSTHWTAPASSGPVVLTLTVTDSKGASASLSVTVTVSNGNGSAAVNVSFNTWPQVASVTATPTSVAVGQATQVASITSDADGDPLSYQWTASCAGSWTTATSRSASFTPSEQPSSNTCTLSVTVLDGRGGQGTGSLIIHVGAPTTGRFPPEVVEAFQSVASVPAGGGTVVFRVRAKDVQGSALSFTWSTSSGTLGTASSTASTSEVLWTAPSCVPAGNPPTVTATVTNALSLSESYDFTLQGGTSCSFASGKKLAGGPNHSLALRPDGTVWAWGYNGYGQLGDGTMTDRHTPVLLPGLTGVVAVDAGYRYSLVLKADGTVWAWGQNHFGELGDGTTTTRLTPVQVQGLTRVVAVSAGSANSLVLKADGTVWAWGRNQYGQVGDGTTTTRLTPVQVQGLTGVVAIAGGSLNGLVLKSDGTVWSWGYNGNGEVGDGTTTMRLTPVQVQGLTGVVAIADGSHSLAVKSDGTAWGWGNNHNGQLGDGTLTTRLTPVQVQGLTGVVAITTGNMKTVALKSDGSVWAWGYNGYGMGSIGEGPTVNHRVTPRQMQGLTGVIAIDGHGAYTLALKSDGTVWAWGINRQGQLGDGTTMDRSSPVQVQGLNL